MLKAILLLQTGLVLLGFGISFPVSGQAAALAVLYGGGIAITNTLMLGARVARAGAVTGKSMQHGMIMLYLNAVLRFIFVVAALGVGMGVLKLMPLPLVLAFAGTQAGFVLLSIRMSKAV